MSDAKLELPKPPRFPVTDEDIQKIAGGSCTLTDLSEFLKVAKDAYESAIDFSVYVMERVAGAPPGGNTGP